MKRTITDGWHIIAGYDVYVEGGKVLRGLSSDKQRTTYPFRYAARDGWTNDSGLSVDAFRAGVRRGTITMF